MRTSSLFAVAALAALGAFTTGCGASLIPFTQELREQHGLSNEDVKNLQFYISSKVIMRHELERGGRSITPGHKLVIVSGKTIEEVVIEEHTPGVAVAVSSDSVKVAFEPGSSLEFTPSGRFREAQPVVQESRFARPPNPFPGNNGSDEPSSSTQSDATGGYFLAVAQNGTITYGATTFDVVSASYDARLMVDGEALNKVEKSRKVLPGMRLVSN